MSLAAREPRLLGPAELLTPEKLATSEDRRLLRSGVCDHCQHTVFTDVIRSRSGWRRFKSQAATYVRILTCRQWHFSDHAAALKSLSWERHTTVWFRFLSRREVTLLSRFFLINCPLPVFFLTATCPPHSSVRFAHLLKTVSIFSTVQPTNMSNLIASPVLQTICFSTCLIC